MNPEPIRVQHDASSPTGQRGATPIRRPPNAAPPSEAPKRETALPRSFQAEQGYGFGAEPGSQRPADPRSVHPNEAHPAAHEAEPGASPAAAEAGTEQRPDEWAQRYAQIQRRERQMHMQSQDIKRREQELQQREARVREYEELQALKEKDPKTFLEKNGLSFERITDVYLNDGKPTPEQKIEALEARIQSLIEGREQEKEQEISKSAQEKVEGFKRTIEGVIESEGERFELIKAQKAHSLVFDVIQNYWRETGQMLPVAEAADFVENELFTEAQQLMGLSKFKPKPQPADVMADDPMPDRPTQRPPEPQRNPTRQHVPGRSQTVVRDSGGINNLSYAQQTKKDAARMIRFR